MVNIIWLLMVIIAILYAIITGKMDRINDAILDSPKQAFYIVFEIGVMIVFWSGILEVARKGGFLELVGKGIKKIIRPLFPEIPSDSVAFDYISANIAANILGLGSAATPMGLKAMKELSKLNSERKEASKSMITLLIINTSGLTLIPTSLIALRRAYGGKITVQIIPYVICSTIITTIIAIIIDFLFRRATK